MSKGGIWEWSDSNVNWQRGCTHACLYCYARAMALHPRRGPPRIQSGCGWERPRIIPEAIAKNYQKRTGVIMVPTTHDITRHNFLDAQVVLRKLLVAGNYLVIVSKPDIGVWRAMLGTLADYKEQVLLRFTIGCLDGELQRFWEPGAPPIEERLDTLKLAHKLGFKTSVSCEPLLDPPHVKELVEAVQGFVTEDIWIGACKHLRQRVAWCIRDEGVAGMVAWLEQHQTLVAMRNVFEAVCGNPLVRFKDSYQKALGLDGPKGRKP